MPTPDPFKQSVRDYDARVVAKGGSSLFAAKPPSGLMVPVKDNRGRPARWFGPELSNARAAYCSREPLKVVAARLGTGVFYLSRLAAQHGWPRRNPRTQGS